MAQDEIDINVGRVDMLLRFALSAVLFSANVLVTPPNRWIAVAGFLPLMTGLFRYCPVYSLLGVRTCGAVPLK